MFSMKNSVYWVTFLLFLGTAGGFWFGYDKLSKEITELKEQNQRQNDQISYLRGDFASTTSLLSGDIEETKKGLSSAIAEEKKNLEEKLGDVQNQVGQVSGSVKTLEKLSKTDPELLQKYSKVYFLNEHYEPPRLSKIPARNRYFDSRLMQIHQSVAPYLEGLLNEGGQSGQEIYVYSAYRSFDEQQELKGQYAVTYGEGANKFSADQGYSEHQLGTTVDLITLGIGGILEGFEKTDEYKWLSENAYKYGFVLSYPKNNLYYIFEPWHWRFVGVELATHLHKAGQNFYDLEQRKIDEYLVNIFE